MYLDVFFYIRNFQTREVCLEDGLDLSWNPYSKNMELKSETDPTYIGIYTTTENSYTIKEEGVYIITVVANLENEMPLKYIFKQFKYDSSLDPHDDDKTDEDKDKDNGDNKTLIIALAVAIPIVIILIGIIIFILWKKRNQAIEKNIPAEEDSQALVRDTLNTTKE